MSCVIINCGIVRYPPAYSASILMIAKTTSHGMKRNGLTNKEIGSVVNYTPFLLVYINSRLEEFFYTRFFFIGGKRTYNIDFSHS